MSGLAAHGWFLAGVLDNTDGGTLARVGPQVALVAFVLVSAWLWAVFGLVAAALRARPGRLSQRPPKVVAAVAMVNLAGLVTVYVLLLFS